LKATALLGLIVVAAPASALATAPPATRVVGVVAGAPKELGVLEAALGDSLAQQKLALVLTTADSIAAADVTRNAGDAEEVIARFQLDLTALPLAKLYLVDGGRRQVYVRWLSLPKGLDPVAVELIRFVVASSVEAIRTGRKFGVSREEYDRSLNPPVGPPAGPSLPLATSSTPGPSPLDLGAAVKYEITQMGRGRFQQGPGISLAARLPHLWIGADLLARIPIMIGGQAADARIRAGALRITASVPILSSRDTSLAVGLGGGIDVSQVGPAARRPDLTATPPFWATSPFLRLFGTLAHDFGRLSLAGVVGLDVDLIGERYVVTETSGTPDVFAPGRVRPLAAILVGARR
jgi:hypothetical protein